MECAFVDEVAPALTNVREFAPPRLDMPRTSVIPMILRIQSIAAEYAEEYITVEPMDRRVLYIVSFRRCWRRQS
jgi:hypothetical protein